MIVHVRGHEGDPQPLARTAAHGRPRRQRALRDGARPALRGAKLRERRERHREYRERQDRKLCVGVLALETLPKPREQLGEPVPGAALLPRMRELRQRVAITRVELERPAQRSVGLREGALLYV